MDRTTTVADLESDLENALVEVRELDRHGQLPRELRPLLLLSPLDGTSVHVSLRQRDKARQLPRNSSSQTYSQRSCAAWIGFEAPPISIEDQGSTFEEFIRALDRAEQEPQLHFVSLKWFRDTYLHKLRFDWAQDPEIPRRMLQLATEREMVLTSKVPNPNSPEFPVTSIHLNRKHPDVERILGAPPSATDERLEP